MKRSGRSNPAGGTPLNSEGDLNISPRRQAWLDANSDAETRRWLDEDAKYFLHQSLSTPCLDVLTACAGPYLQDLRGKRISYNFV